MRGGGEVKFYLKATEKGPQGEAHEESLRAIASVCIVLTSAFCSQASSGGLGLLLLSRAINWGDKGVTEVSKDKLRLTRHLPSVHRPSKSNGLDFSSTSHISCKFLRGPAVPWATAGMEFCSAGVPMTKLTVITSV